MKKQRSVLMKQIAINDSFGSVFTSSDQVTSEGEICITGVTRYKCPMDMTQEELKEFIKNGGPDFCNKVMGVKDCGSKPGASSTDPTVKSDSFKKWEDAGGQCPKGVKNSICSTGCRSEASSSNVFNTGTCYY